MDVTPSPRILRMLGEIEFDEWQCIAELVDNAFDDFSEISAVGQPWPGGYKVSVSLPSPAAPLTGAEVVVKDTGRGMTRETLEQAVKAGWSSNDRFDKLGLFGMGFNVATARLGRRTRVLTTREGDPEWIGVEIDLEKLGDDFEAPDITAAKDDPSEHGTWIIVDRLHRDRAEWLQRNGENLRTTLGRVYGWLLDNRPFELWVQGVKVKPRRACRWGDDRFVVFGSGSNAEQIPAYIEIDEKFEPADACELCGNWQNPGKSVCDECGSERLRQRERHLHGWLGVQRHLDKREFGIDFLRNGRKILQYDKSLFNWRNPNDPTGSSEPEYPVELANQGGRLIGEIHLDYVPVHYDKTAFEYSDRSWRAAVDYLRGEAPLQPQKAKAAGYPENDSPLGRLFKGYRRNDAGLRYLIPGDGSRPLHEDTRAWARKFWAGDPDYQSDQKWYEQVLMHEQRVLQSKLDKATGGAASDPDEDAVLKALGGGSSQAPSTPAPAGTGDSSASSPESTKPETVQERVTRYLATGNEYSDLSRDYGLPDTGTIKVDTYTLSEQVIDSEGQPTPVWLVQGAGGTATAFISSVHEAFAKMGMDYSELLIAEIAAALKVKSDSHQTFSQIAARLRAMCLPDTAVDAGVVRAQASELLSDIRSRMAERVAQDPQRALSVMDPDEQTQTETALIADGADTMTASLGADGNFVIYAPPLYLVKLLESWPEAFLDGLVFAPPYASLTSASSRRLSIARVVGYLNDLATLLTFQSPNITQLRRTRLSVELLARELAPES